MPFTHDVFLSYSSLDKEVVHDLAVRLRDRGLRVWLDAWEIQDEDVRQDKIREGLEASRVLVLCMSERALGFERSTLERQTFPFRDPTNRERRFIPLRLDDATPRGSLAQFLAIDWRERSDAELEKLVRACRPESEATPRPEPALAASGGDPIVRTISIGHTDEINAVAAHPDGTRALSASDDTTVRVWNLQTACQHVLEGHTAAVWDVAAHPDGAHALSASEDRTVRVWNLHTHTCEHVLEGHTHWVLGIAVTADGARALSASQDRTVRVWNLHTHTCEHVLKGHTGAVRRVAVTPDGARVLSASEDRTVRVWNLQTGACEHILEGHTDRVLGVAVTPDGTRALSASTDRTVRVWNLQTGACEHILEGHTGWVFGVTVTPDGTRALSASNDRTVRVWNLQSAVCEHILEGHTAAVRGVAVLPDGTTILSWAENGVVRLWTMEAVDPEPGPIDKQALYTNAKVVLVGESQAGKTGLALRLAHDRWELTESTVGAWATQLRLPEAGHGGDREIWLWDFGGQADQRLVHQLYMGDAALAVLVFDGHREDTVARLWDWHRALRSSGRDVPTLLVAGRTDANPVRLSAGQLDELREAGGFAKYLETSAKNDVGCRELGEAIVAAIDWSRIPWRSSPEVFRRLKRAILDLKDTGRALTSAKELRDWLPAQIGPFEPEQLDAVIGLLAGPGAVLPLEFGDYVLLRPELINTYAQVVIASLRDDPLERGCIAEERVLRGELSFAPDFARLDEADERVVLHAMHRRLVERAICLREHDPRGREPTMLVFPSFYRRERPEKPGRPQAFVSYHFDGYLDEVYATLVVRLHHTRPFESSELWRNAADLKTAGGKAIGLRLLRRDDGSGELELHCERDTPVEDQALLDGYVGEHLRMRATEVTRLRTYICPKCATPVENRDAARRRLERGEQDIGCSDCEHRIPLWDEIERRHADPELRVRVGELQEEAQVVLDNESRGRLLVGEVYAMAARANQIARELTVSDHGIDMEIEFKADDGKATGRKLYLQLKSGDSHLRRRKRDDERVFRIKDKRHAEYWANQGFPVLLVVRDSEGAVEWMEIGEHLRARRAAGDWPAREIAFDGERFDVMSIRRLRDRMLRGGGV